MLAGLNQIIFSLMSLGNCSDYSRSEAVLYCVFFLSHRLRGCPLLISRGLFVWCFLFPCTLPSNSSSPDPPGLSFLSPQLCKTAHLCFDSPCLTPHYSLVAASKDISLAITDSSCLFFSFHGSQSWLAFCPMSENSLSMYFVWFSSCLWSKGKHDLCYFILATSKIYIIKKYVVSDKLCWFREYTLIFQSFEIVEACIRTFIVFFPMCYQL